MRLFLLATLLFAVTASRLPAAELGFPIPDRYPTGLSGNNWPFTCADFTSDGHPDILLTHNLPLPGVITVLPADGMGGLGTPITNTFSAIPKLVTVGDFNEDGKLDLLGPVYSGTQSLNMLQLFYGDGRGGFRTGPTLAGPANTLACGDFDQDGHLDFARDAMETLQVYRGNGKGAFALSATLAPPYFLLPRELAVVDLNADGRLDLVYRAGPITARLNLGGGIFGPEVITNPGGINLTLSDVNHDQFPDIAQVVMGWYGEPSAVQVGLGLGDGTFAMGTQHWLLLVSGRQYGIAVGDFTGDGHSDVVAGDGYAEAAFLTGLENGAVEPGSRYLIGGIFPTALDLDADGVSECVVGDGEVFSVIQSGPTGLRAPRAVGTNWLGEVLATGDVNGDGFRDMVTSHKLAGLNIGVSVLLGAPGRFLPAFTVPVVREAKALSLGDLDGDGYDDLVIGSLPGNGKNLEILRGSASGQLTPWADINNGSANAIYDRGLCLADMNGDGSPDIVTSTFGPLSVQLNQGNGTFANSIQSGQGRGSVSSLLPGDFDGDGRMDAVAVADVGDADNVSSIILVNLGGGDGTLQLHQYFFVDAGSPSAVAGRVDGDALPDLLLVGGSGTHGGLGGFYHFRNLGGTFDLQYRDTTAPGGDVVAADFNGDTLVEVATSSAAFGNSRVEVRVNDGAGGLTQVLELPRVAAPYDMLAANLVGGTRPDLAVLNSEFNPSTIVLFENSESSPVGVRPTPEMSYFAAYPNPFNSTTTIEYRVGDPGRVTLRVYNVAGQLVRKLVDEDVNMSSEHTFKINWNGRTDTGEMVSSGVYFYRLTTRGFTQTKKAVFLK